ncbi:hypothetical protein QYE76_013804 [Lolium multiflorum]|uniref:Transposase (putative) gypsy type domain-containing protein n=1 Tax=Lolium multiflorum TaxID=4521 RepID=A0AAD8U3P1_LOLMU|nr:hypothetical protein QYE76_013804 [Lolium multiflorum]
MAPRTKRTKNIAAGTADRVEKEKISGWERSKISSQDHRMLKKMGLLKEQAKVFPILLKLHQLTPNSILHISIFITLCEFFLGIHPHWEAGYFDLKFADSVQGWREKWLYVKDESSDTQEYSLAPFDLSEDILRRKSWDAEATAEEIAATESVVARIQAL